MFLFASQGNVVTLNSFLSVSLSSFSHVTASKRQIAHILFNPSSDFVIKISCILHRRRFNLLNVFSGLTRRLIMLLKLT